MAVNYPPPFCLFFDFWYPTSLSLCSCDNPISTLLQQNKYLYSTSLPHTNLILFNIWLANYPTFFSSFPCLPFFYQSPKHSTFPLSFVLLLNFILQLAPHPPLIYHMWPSISSLICKFFTLLNYYLQLVFHFLPSLTPLISWIPFIITFTVACPPAIP